MLIAAAVALIVGGCSRSPVVTIDNQSSQTLSNIVVSGSGFSNEIGSIDPGEKHKLTVHPVGESGLRIRFYAGTERIDSGEQDYFEPNGGYRVSAVISTDLSVSVSSELGSY